MTLVQAVYAAGGFLETAQRSNVVLVRKDEQGSRISRAVDVRAVASGKDASQDVPLQPYDMVFVPRSGITNVNLWVQQYIRDNLPVNLVPLF